MLNSNANIMATEIRNESETTFPNLAEIFSSNPNRTDYNYFSPGVVYLYSENVNPSPALKIRTSCKLSLRTAWMYFILRWVQKDNTWEASMRRWQSALEQHGSSSEKSKPFYNHMACAVLNIKLFNSCLAKCLRKWINLTEKNLTPSNS